MEELVVSVGFRHEINTVCYRKTPRIDRENVEGFSYCPF